MNKIDGINKQFFPGSFDYIASNRIEGGIREQYLKKLSKIKTGAAKAEKARIDEASRKAEKIRKEKLSKPITPTNRQLEALHLIDCHQEEFGFSITYEEMASVLGFKSDTASYELVTALVKKELVTRKKGKSRTILLTEKGKEAIQ